MPAVLGGYQLLERIAVGGMAEVFLAAKAGPEGWLKRVALKRILPHLGRQPDFVTMFLDEARLAARLCHANVVQVHDFGVEDGVYFLAMEHVAGKELTALIRAGRPLPVEDALAILIAAAEGLHHVHEQGIVHRDVTPSNLLLSYDGVVKLTDFGIAKLAERQTQAGVLKGKIAYMSPEQARGEPLDRRSDIYSLAVCAWELLTMERLRPPLDELQLLPLVQSGELPAARGLPEVVMQALSPDPSLRPSSAREFGERLAAQLTVPPSAARLAERMREYFGERPPETEMPTEPTAVHSPTPPRPVRLPRLAMPPRLLAPLSRVVVHLHLPPLKMPRLRLLLPLFAIVLSLSGLLYALRTPRPVHAPAAARPAEAAPRPPLHKLKTHAGRNRTNIWAEGTSP